MDKKKQVLKMLEQERILLHILGTEYGLSHPTVVECSKRLDKLHNQYNQLNKAH